MKPVSKVDLEKMQQRLAELTEQVNAQLDGTSRVAKMDQVELVRVIQDVNADMLLRNAATEKLLAHLNGDVQEFSRLVRDTKSNWNDPFHTGGEGPKFK